MHSLQTVVYRADGVYKLFPAPLVRGAGFLLVKAKRLRGSQHQTEPFAKPTTFPPLTRSPSPDKERLFSGG